MTKTIRWPDLSEYRAVIRMFRHGSGERSLILLRDNPEVFPDDLARRLGFRRNRNGFWLRRNPALPEGLLRKELPETRFTEVPVRDVVLNASRLGKLIRGAADGINPADVRILGPNPDGNQVYEDGFGRYMVVLDEDSGSKEIIREEEGGGGPDFLRFEPGQVALAVRGLYHEALPRGAQPISRRAVEYWCGLHGLDHDEALTAMREGFADWVFERAGRALEQVSRERFAALLPQLGAFRLRLPAIRSTDPEEPDPILEVYAKAMYRVTGIRSGIRVNEWTTLIWNGENWEKRKNAELKTPLLARATCQIDSGEEVSLTFYGDASIRERLDENLFVPGEFSDPAQLGTWLGRLGAAWLGEVLSPAEAERRSAAQPEDDTGFGEVDGATLSLPYTPHAGEEFLDPGYEVPVNLAAPISRALRNLRENEAGGKPLGEWVAGRFGVSTQTLAGRLHAPQVDAVALGIRAFDRREGLLVGDGTGTGKGRILAALAQYAVLRGKKAIFLTSDADLLSDFIGHLEGVEAAEDMRPFVLNNTPLIRDGVVYHPRIKPSEHKAIIASGELPDGVNLILGTYSQVCGRRSAKANWVRWVVDRLGERGEEFVVLCDEGDIAAGDGSNTMKFISELFTRPNFAGAAVSSGTLASDLRSFSLYQLILPENAGINTSMIRSTGKNAGAYSIALLSALAENGNVISRKLFMNPEWFSVRTPSGEQLERNLRIEAALSNIARGVLRFNNRLNEIINERANALVREIAVATPGGGRVARIDRDWLVKRISRELATKNNVGNMLDRLRSAAAMALSAEDVAEAAVDRISRGGKFVCCVDRTLGSLTEELMRQAREDSPLIGDTFDLGGKLTLGDMVRAAVRAYMDGMNFDIGTRKLSSWIREERARGNRNQQGGGLERFLAVIDAEDEEDPGAEPLALDRVLLEPGMEGGAEDGEGAGEGNNEILLDIRHLIEADRELGVLHEEIIGMTREMDVIDGSPLDVIRRRIEGAGYTVAEATGRKYIVNEHESGGHVITKAEAEGTRAAVDGFQSGVYDAIIIGLQAMRGHNLNPVNRSPGRRTVGYLAGTGTMTGKDLLQGAGRVYRFRNEYDEEGNLIASPEPEYILFLPSGSEGIGGRGAGLLLEKVGAVTASSEANRRNALSGIEIGANLFNEVGEQVVREYLRENRRLAEDLGIKIPDGDSGLSDAVAARRLYNRLFALPMERQQQLLAKLGTLYEERIEYLDKIGRNPFKNNIIAEPVEVIQSIPLSLNSGIGGMDGKDPFERPVILSLVRYEREIYPLLSAEVEHLARNFSELLPGDPASSLVTRETPFQSLEGRLNTSYEIRLARLREKIETQERVLREHENEAVLSEREIKELRERIENARNEISKLDSLRNRILETAGNMRYGAVIRYRYEEEISGEGGDGGEAKRVIREVPAIVVGMRAGTSIIDDPLRPGDHTFIIAIPGREYPLRLTMATLFRHMEEKDDLFIRDGKTGDPLNLFDESSEEAKLLREGFDRAERGRRTVREPLLHGNIVKAFNNGLNPLTCTIVSYRDKDNPGNILQGVRFDALNPAVNHKVSLMSDEEILREGVEMFPIYLSGCGEAALEFCGGIVSAKTSEMIEHSMLGMDAEQLWIPLFVCNELVETVQTSAYRKLTQRHQAMKVGLKLTQTELEYIGQEGRGGYILAEFRVELMYNGRDGHASCAALGDWVRKLAMSGFTPTRRGDQVNRDNDRVRILVPGEGDDWFRQPMPLEWLRWGNPYRGELRMNCLDDAIPGNGRSHGDLLILSGIRSSGNMSAQGLFERARTPVELTRNTPRGMFISPGVRTARRANLGVMCLIRYEPEGDPAEVRKSLVSFVRAATGSLFDSCQAAALQLYHELKEPDTNDEQLLPKTVLQIMRDVVDGQIRLEDLVSAERNAECEALFRGPGWRPDMSLPERIQWADVLQERRINGDPEQAPEEMVAARP